MTKRKKVQCAGVLLALFAVQMVMHLNADSLILDDWVFFDVLATGKPLLSWLSKRWQTWSSRLLIEGTLCLTTHSIWAWRILDSAAMVLLAFGLCRLTDAEKRPFMLAAASLMVTTIPFAILRSTGWQATSLNYYWPLACAVFSMIPLADALWKRKTGRLMQLSAVVLALYGANQEQTAALIVGAYTVLGAALLIRDRRVSPVLVIVWGIALVELAAHLFCPGNDMRAAQSVAMVNLRDYGQFSFVDKLSIGLSSTSALLLFTYNPLLLAVSACVVCMALARKRSAWEIVLAALPAAFALLMTAGRLPAGTLNRTAREFGSYTLMLGPRYAGVAHAVMMFAVVMVLGLMALALYLSIGHRPLAACAVFVFALGFAARLALAFSPTVVESGERTMMPLYGAMMLCALFCLRDAPRRWPMAAAFGICLLLCAQNFLESFALAI